MRRHVYSRIRKVFCRYSRYLWISATPVPFCLHPKLSTGGQWWIQDNGTSLPGRGSVLYGAFVWVFAITTTALALADGLLGGRLLADDPGLKWAMIIIYPPGLVAATGFIVWGLFLWSHRMRVECDPHSQQVSLIEAEPGFSEQQLAGSPVGECTLIIQDVIIRADNKVAGPWRGVALVLRIQDWSFVLACQKTRQELTACVESLPAWLQGLPQEEGPLLRRRGVVGGRHL